MQLNYVFKINQLDKYTHPCLYNIRFGERKAETKEVLYDTK